jgi:hypothetical protein
MNKSLKTHRFNLMLDDDDQRRLRRVAGRLDWTQADTVRWLIALAAAALTTVELERLSAAAAVAESQGGVWPEGGLAPLADPF